MFSMTSLQSQHSPLRTFQTFYKPINRPHSKSVKKTFPNIIKRSEISDLYNPSSETQKELSTRKYLDTLEKNKTLQRRRKQRGELEAFVTFRRHQQMNPQSQNNSSVMSKERSILSLKLGGQMSRVQSVCSILDKKHRSSFKNRWRQFSHQKTSLNQQKKDNLRFTFYNSREKNHKMMEKYWRDESLEERGSNAYQNVFNRTIVEESLVRLLGEVERRRRRGEVV